MYKLLFDTDALIKITKSGLLEITVNTFNLLITEEVYDEAVKEGKKRLYEDAELIDSVINKMQLLKKSEYVNKPKPKHDFGKGEISVFQSYGDNRVIVTDDLKFTVYLRKKNRRHMSSANILPVLVRKKKLKIEQAVNALEKMRLYIRKKLYEKIKEDLKNESSATTKNR